MTTDHLTHDRPAGPVRHAASKVPEVTVYFWITKVLTAARALRTAATDRPGEDGAAWAMSGKAGVLYRETVVAFAVE